MLYISRLTAEGQWEGLRSTTDADYAEDLLDYFCDKFPGAYIDILTYDEFHGGQAKWQAMSI
jgi:hypothetical protein